MPSYNCCSCSASCAALLSDASQPRQAPERTPDSNATNPRTPGGGDSLILRLLRLVEGSLSRIQLQQAASLPQDDPQRQAWQLDLPIHLNDEVQDAMLRIEREGSSEADPDQATWAVQSHVCFRHHWFAAVPHRARRRAPVLNLLV
jgi:hypothetical protein